MFPPTRSLASVTSTDVSGAFFFLSVYAVESPETPAPTTTTSTSRAPASPLARVVIVAARARRRRRPPSFARVVGATHLTLAFARIIAIDHRRGASSRVVETSRARSIRLLSTRSRGGIR